MGMRGVWGQGRQGWGGGRRDHLREGQISLLSAVFTCPGGRTAPAPGGDLHLSSPPGGGRGRLESPRTERPLVATVGSRRGRRGVGGHFLPGPGAAQFCKGSAARAGGAEAGSGPEARARARPVGAERPPRGRVGEGGEEVKETKRLAHRLRRDLDASACPPFPTPWPKFFRLELNLASQELAPPPTPRSGAAAAPPLYPGTEATPLPPANTFQGPPRGTQPSFTFTANTSEPSARKHLINFAKRAFLHFAGQVTVTKKVE